MCLLFLSRNIEERNGPGQYLAIYGFRQCDFVPAFQAVYGGWSVNVGAVGWPSSEHGVRIMLAYRPRVTSAPTGKTLT